MPVVPFKFASFFIPVKGLLPIALRSATTRIVSPLNEAGSLRPQLRITVITTRADLRAPGPRIKCMIRPLDF